MADRIDKIHHLETWQVQETHNAEDDAEKHQHDEEDAHSHLSEKTDWLTLLDSTHYWKKNIRLETKDIDQIFFTRYNLKTDPSLVQLKITLKNRQVYPIAFISLARIMALKLQSVKAGQEIPLTAITKDAWLTITIPKENVSAPKPLPGSRPPSVKSTTKISAPSKIQTGLPPDNEQTIISFMNKKGLKPAMVVALLGLAMGILILLLIFLWGGI